MNKQFSTARIFCACLRTSDLESPSVCRVTCRKMKWTLCFLLSVCCCVQGASFINRYLDLLLKFNVFSALRPDYETNRWQFNNITINKNQTTTTISIGVTSVNETSSAALENDSVVQSFIDNAATQITGLQIGHHTNDAIGGQLAQDNLIQTQDYEEDYDPSLFIEDDARSLGKFRSVRKRTKRGMSSKKISQNENGDDTSKEEYDF